MHEDHSTDAAGAPGANLLDELDRALAPTDGASPPAALVVPHSLGSCDVFLAGRRDGWVEGGGDGIGRALIAHPAVTEATPDRSGNRILLRVDDERIAALGAALELGRTEGFLGRDLARGQRFVVDYCDTNATKALHVGHLRIVALGHALACLASSCGADVVHQTQIGDIGRSMGEALAGYVSFARGETPESAGLKSDHFVGACYRRYVDATASSAQPAGDAARDPALSREDGAHDDLAEELLARRRAGDAEVVQCWRRLRDWSMEGQDRTLARLGVHFDRVLYESDFLARTHRVTELALERGVVTRSADGAVISPDTEDGHLLLHRPDGFPTQHMRYIAMWHATRELLAGTTSLSLMGDEWEPLAQKGREILTQLAPAGEEPHPTQFVVHGMVTLGSRAVKSSDGEPLLIDALLDELLLDPRLRALADEHDRADAERLAAMALLGVCLDCHQRKPLALEREQLLDQRANAGWLLACALAAAWHPRYDGDPRPAPEDADYRAVVLRSQLHRRLAERSLRGLDLRPLLALHTHAATWFLAREQPSPAVARAMRGLLGCGLRGLGFDREAPVLRAMTC